MLFFLYNFISRDKKRNTYLRIFVVSLGKSFAELEIPSHFAKCESLIRTLTVINVADYMTNNEYENSSRRRIYCRRVSGNRRE